MIKVVLSIILFVVAGGLLFAYASPEYGKTQDVLKEVEQYTEANAKVREVQELRSSLTAKYQQLSPQNIARLQAFLPDHVDNVKLVLDLDGIAARRGIRIGNVSARRDEQKSATGSQSSLSIDTASLEVQKHRSLVLEFTVTAPYNDFVLFMRELEQSLRIVDLVTLKMEAAALRSATSNLPPELRSLVAQPDAASGIQEYSFTVSLKTYWLP